MAREVENFFKKLDFLHLFTKSPQDEYNEQQQKLQQQQFEYQKWYDANNIQLKTQDAMKAGINPLVATNGNTSSVTATSQPQMPENNSSAGLGLISDMVGKLISHNEHKQELNLERDKLQLARDTQEANDANQQQYFSILRARAGADITRTQIYNRLADIQGEESRTRRQSMAYDLAMRVQDQYGTQSTVWKKLLGELRSLGIMLAGDSPTSKPSTNVPSEKDLYGDNPHFKEYWLLKQKGSFKGSFNDFLADKYPSESEELKNKWWEK